MSPAVTVDEPFNTNGYVWVQLNDVGWRMFDEFHSRIGLDPTRFREHIAPGGWQKFPLWELMHIFGPSMYLGGQVPFKQNVVRFTAPTEAPL